MGVILLSRIRFEVGLEIETSTAAAERRDRLADTNAERIEVYLQGVRETRDLAEEVDDQDTVDLLTGIITEFEKHGWFLRATLEG